MTFKQVLKKDKAIDWDVFLSRHRELTPLYANVISASSFPRRHLRASIGIDFEFRYFKRVGDTWFWSVSERDALEKLIERKASADPAFFNCVIQRAERNCDDLVRWSHKIQKRKFSSNSDEELSHLFQVYWEKLRRAASFMVVKHVFNGVLEKKVKAGLRNSLARTGQEADLQKHFEVLLVPQKETLFSRAHKELLKLKKHPTRLGIKKWLLEYDWIGTFCWSGEVLTEANVLSKLAFITSDDRGESKTYKGPVPSELRREVSALQRLLYVHTYEIECIFACRYWCRNFLEEVARRIGFSFNEYVYLTHRELASALAGKTVLSKSEVLRRKGNKFALMRFDDTLTIWQGSEFEVISGQSQVKSVASGMIRGTVAFSGKVTGRACIVLSIKEFRKFKKGEILITPMTTIDYTPYLTTVGAIITDEGGITCHAAVVSRELKVPCIIGTKIATKVLKDGDMVEVDADKGVVTIIKKA